MPTWSRQRTWPTMHTTMGAQLDFDPFAPAWLTMLPWDRPNAPYIDFDHIMVTHPCAYCQSLGRAPRAPPNNISWNQRVPILRDGRYSKGGDYFYCAECWLWWKDEYNKHWEKWKHLCISFAGQQPTRELVGYLHTLELT
jgi:hypothetical protein